MREGPGTNERGQGEDFRSKRRKKGGAFAQRK